MKNKYNIVYAVALLAIVLVLALVNPLNDMIEMGLYSSAIVLTAIFTYSNRRIRNQNISNPKKDETVNGSKEE